MPPPLKTIYNVSDLPKLFDEAYAQSRHRATGISDKGDISVVMVPAHEYFSLRYLMTKALASKDLQDVIAQITRADGEPHAQAAQSYADTNDEKS